MQHPLLYEINTRCWLNELKAREGRDVTLADVPEGEISQWRRLGFTHIWLMGVWTTGHRSREHALHDPRLRRRYAEILPDWTPGDVPGSPYAIAEYEVPPALGGARGLAHFGERLHAAGMRLILDFVPNHAGLDHPWVESWPELCVQAGPRSAGSFVQKGMRGTHWLAHGKDPYFPGWVDTVQLDFRNPATRSAMTLVLKAVAAQCDGARCDMAMLLLRDVFQKNWKSNPCGVEKWDKEFWLDAIQEVKAEHPGFQFFAEAYWGLEPALQDLGFDFTYNKRFYDRLIEKQHGDLQSSLMKTRPSRLSAGIQFIENHDEPRIAGKMEFAEHRAAAVAMFALPGARLVHEGQLTGARIHAPVQLGRRPAEAIDVEVSEFYMELLQLIRESAVGTGEWEFPPLTPAWEGNPTAQNFVVVRWQAKEGVFDLVSVNLAAHRGQCRVELGTGVSGRPRWKARDCFGGGWKPVENELVRNGGLLLDLPQHGVRWLRFERVA